MSYCSDPSDYLDIRLKRLEPWNLTAHYRRRYNVETTSVSQVDKVTSRQRQFKRHEIWRHTIDVHIQRRNNVCLWRDKTSLRQRRNNVVIWQIDVATRFRLKIDVETTSCAHWVIGYYTVNVSSHNPIYFDIVCMVRRRSSWCSFSLYMYRFSNTGSQHYSRFV